MSKNNNFILILTSILLFSNNFLKAEAQISLECSSYEKQVQVNNVNKEIFEKKLSDEKLKGENAKQEVVQSIEERIKEIDVQLEKLQDVLDLCHGKINPPDPKKCLDYKKQIESFESNVKILEDKISKENTKENPKPEVISVAESKISDLKVQIKTFQDILSTCEEVQAEEKLPVSTVDLRP